MTLDKMHEMVLRFNRDIIGLPIPDKPTLLSHDRCYFRRRHLCEEMDEIEKGVGNVNLEQVTDGLLDLIYVAMGTLIEMGITPGAAFEEVHRANMAKRQGAISKRPGSLGFDAVKPEGWTPPDLGPYLTITREQILIAHRLPEPASDPIPIMEVPITDIGIIIPEELRGTTLRDRKILVIGHGRHGKDTVSEMLRDQYGRRFTSSSLFCAENVIFAGIEAETTPELAGLKGKYNNFAECFQDRHNHRALWYDTIRALNRPDATALGRAIFKDHDVYCGLRSKAELNALKNAGIVDTIIWVDRSDFVPREASESCTVEPWMADYVLDNNGTLEDLEFNVKQLMENLL